MRSQYKLFFSSLFFLKNTKVHKNLVAVLLSMTFLFPIYSFVLSRTVVNVYVDRHFFFSAFAIVTHICCFFLVYFVQVLFQLNAFCVCFVAFNFSTVYKRNA